MSKRSCAPVLPRCAGILLCLSLAGCGEDTPTPTAPPPIQVAVTLAVTAPVVAPTNAPSAANPTHASAPALPNLDLNLPTTLATGSRQQSISAKAAPADAPFWIGHPAHTLTTFDGYIRTNTLHAPSISVYAVRDLQAFNPLTRMRVEGLQAALKERSATPREVVIIDLYKGTQVLQVQPSYLSFQGGRGVRYVTQYVDEAVPINNRELFYAFQGLSDDGQYVISAILPLSAPGLPDDGSTGVAQLGGALNAPEFQSYMQQIEATLGALPPEQFAPALNELDRLIASLKLTSGS